MPNYCEYEMKIKGSKNAIERVMKCLNADYDYSKGKPSHKHFFRVFGAYNDEEMEKNEDGTFTQYLYGDCAWSVYCCMCSGEHTYYNHCKEEFSKNFMGTTLLEQSKDCEIEVFSEEEGMNFSEHYLFVKGECVVDHCVEMIQAGYTKNGKVTTKIDWDTYEGDVVAINSNREGIGETYRWEI